LENKKKATTNSLKNVLKKKKVEEGEALGLGVKREHESKNVKAQKMMKGRMELVVVQIVV
jgi:hypothetical protein